MISASGHPSGSAAVQLVNDDDDRRVLFRLLKSLPKVTLQLSSHLGHDLWAIDLESLTSSSPAVASGSPRHYFLLKIRIWKQSKLKLKIHNETIDYRLQIEREVPLDF